MLEERRKKTRWSIYCANSRNDLNAVPLEPAVCKRTTDQRNKGHTKGNDGHFECVVRRGFRARWMELLLERPRIHCLFSRCQTGHERVRIDGQLDHQQLTKISFSLDAGRTWRIRRIPLQHPFAV